MDKKNKIKLALKGRVVSDKMQKTIVLEVASLKIHSKYKKRYLVSKKYKAHDEKNEAKTGDEVLVESCRPISKDKKWRLVKIIKKAALAEMETAGS